MCHPERRHEGPKSRDRLKFVVLATALLCLAAMPMGSSSADRGFMDAMSRMNHAMNAAPMTGDTDRDFLAMMIPHHQGAVDMCKTELRYGRSAQVLALCRSIVASQSSQIAQMRRLLQH